MNFSRKKNRKRNRLREKRNTIFKMVSKKETHKGIKEEVVGEVRE